MPRRGLRSDSGDGRREQVDGLEEESHRRIRSHSRIAGASHGVRRKANGQLSEEVSASEALPGWSLHPPSCLHRSARWHLLGEGLVPGGTPHEARDLVWPTRPLLPP